MLPLLAREYTRIFFYGRTTQRGPRGTPWTTFYLFFKYYKKKLFCESSLLIFKNGILKILLIENITRLLVLVEGFVYQALEWFGPQYTTEKKG